MLFKAFQHLPVHLSMYIFTTIPKFLLIVTPKPIIKTCFTLAKNASEGVSKSWHPFHRKPPTAFIDTR